MPGSEDRRRGLVLGCEAAGRMGGVLATDEVSAQEAFGRAVAGLVGHRADTMSHLESALEADQDLAAAHLLRGYGLRVLGRRDLRSAVHDSLALARRSIAIRGGDRELALAEALECWLGGRADRAAERLELQVEAAPHDLLLMKLIHAIRFIMGDAAGMLSSAARILPAFDAGTVEEGMTRGCLAFALEESGRYEEAEEEGRLALAANPSDVWAMHAVAHVLYERGEMKRGATWLADRDAELEGINNFAGHIAWHEALFLIECGAADRVLEIHDRRIAIYPPNDYRDVSNASTLLLLLQDQGVDVGDRWQRLAAIARLRLGDHGLAFADIHYVLALTGAGCEAEASRFVDSMRREAEKRKTEFDGAVLLDVGTPLAGAIVDAGNGRLARAAEVVERLGPAVHRVGGSRAQRRVIPWVMGAARRRPDPRRKSTGREA